MGLTFTTKSGIPITDKCTQCGGQGKLGRFKFADGKTQATYFCTRCGNYGLFIQHEQLVSNHIYIENLPILKDNTPGIEARAIERRSVWDDRRDLECPQCEEVPTLVRVSKNGLYHLGWACPGCGGYLRDVSDEWAEVDDSTASSRPIYSDFRRGRMPYDEYLKDPWWMRVSWAAKWLAQGKCQLCGMQAHYTGTDWIGLNSHHNNYDRRGRERPSDLIVLCHDCHSKFHSAEG